MRQKTLKDDIAELQQELNRTIERTTPVSLCNGYVLDLSIKLNEMIVQYMERENDNNMSSEEDLYT